jgi:hypothetical protein
VTARRVDLLVRVREARPEDAAQMGRVFVDSYFAANRGIVSEADLAGRSHAQSEAAWLRGMREIEAARAARAGRQRLLVGALAAADAPGFYAALGGRLIGRCAYPDEDGMALDGVIFGWLLPFR